MARENQSQNEQTTNSTFTTVAPTEPTVTPTEPSITK